MGKHDACNIGDLSSNLSWSTRMIDVIEVQVECNWRGDVENLCFKVLSDLGYKGWKLRWFKHEAYCWRERKILDICPCESRTECLQMMLHEIAHICIVELHGNQHTKRFWMWLSCLVYTYLNEVLDERQLRMARIYCPEFTSGV